MSNDRGAITKVSNENDHRHESVAEELPLAAKVARPRAEAPDNTALGDDCPGKVDDRHADHAHGTQHEVEVKALRGHKLLERVG